MFRTAILAVAIAAAALVPTVASAKGGHHGGHGFGRFGFTVIDRSYVADDTCSWQLVKIGRNLYKKQWVCG